MGWCKAIRSGEDCGKVEGPHPSDVKASSIFKGELNLPLMYGISLQTLLGSKNLIRELIREWHGWVSYFRALPLAGSVDDRLCGLRLREMQGSGKR